MSRPETLPPMIILVVDDDPICVALLDEHLRAAGNEVFTARDAAEALDVLDRERVDIVLADWIMPRMSGLELCHTVRRRFTDRFLHFVMLTAHSERQRLVEAFEVGVDDFLSKPLHEAELIARLRAWGRFVRLQRELAGQHAAAMRLNHDLGSANAQLALANQDLAELNTELALANVKLAEMATRDDLTGLPNRREAMRRLEAHWESAAKSGEPLACALVDVDRFKQINDTHGHATGDHVLRHVASVLRDSVSQLDAVFRIGGDEFLALLPGSAAAEAACRAERCRGRLATRHFTCGQIAVPVTVSIGVAERSSEMTCTGDLLHAADMALYTAKRGGRSLPRVGAA